MDPIEDFDPFEYVVGKYPLEVYDYQEGDPRFENEVPPGAIFLKPSVTFYRKQIGGDEGYITGPEGTIYFISLKPWAGADQQKTMLKMEFHFTPEFDPLPDALPVKAPPVPEIPENYTLPPHPHTFNFPGLPIYTMCSDVRYDHKLSLRPGNPAETTTTAADLLNLPDAERVVPVVCPVCDTVVGMNRTLAYFVRELSEVLGEPNPLLELSITHPANIPETRVQPENSPLKVQRYWRYDPVFVSPNLSKPGTMRAEVYSKNHLIRLEPGAEVMAGSHPARELLALPEVKQLELACPFCDEILPFPASFDETIERMVAEQGGPDRLLLWSISHPDDQPETKTPDPNTLISSRRYTPSPNDQMPGRQDGMMGLFMG